MNIKVLMITHNRPAYIELSLERLCNTAPKNLELTIWDNGSDQKTKEVVEKFRHHPCVERVIFNGRNEKLRKPTIWFWENSRDADLIGKVDDDCLVPENWCSVLEQAHKDIQLAGVLSCWHYFPQDFKYELCKKKIQSFGQHKIMRNCWVGGSGYLMKKEVINKIGILKANESFTEFCIRAASKGFINGWYYPFLYQEHMDDPRAPHTVFQSEEDFKKFIPLTAITFGLNTRKQWIQWLIADAQRLQEYSINPYDFIGIRARIKRKIIQMLGGDYFPKIK